MGRAPIACEDSILPAKCLVIGTHYLGKGACVCVCVSLVKAMTDLPLRETTIAPGAFCVGWVSMVIDIMGDKGSNGNQ